MKGLTQQERRILIAILLALVLGAAVRYWRRENVSASMQETGFRTLNSGCHMVGDGEASGFKFI